MTTDLWAGPDRAAKALRAFSEKEIQEVLSPREITVLRTRAGFGCRKESLEALGKRLQPPVTRGRVRAIEGEAIGKLVHHRRAIAAALRDADRLAREAERIAELDDRHRREEEQRRAGFLPPVRR